VNTTVRSISAEGLRAALAENRPIRMLDVRTVAEYSSGHIKDSENIPLDELDSQANSLPKGVEVVLICRTGRRASVAGDQLARIGLEPVVLHGGLVEWLKNGLPVESNSARRVLPLDQQVQLTAGLLILSGTVLGLALNPWWFAIPAFVGSGLIFAGLSGTCGLARLLSRAPWNAVGVGSTCSQRHE
jgi:rhodanese-related sulfurtransferase